MTWLDVKTAVLQKMNAISGATIGTDDAVTDYISAMPYAANEGLQLLATAGRFIKKSLDVTRAAPADGIQKFDMETLVPDFYRLGDVYFSDGVRYGRASNYTVEAGRHLVTRAGEVGNWTIYYDAYPKEVTANTPDAQVMELAPEVAVLLPLYIVSQIYKDDDISIATIYRNEFEAGREELMHVTSTGQERFSSESGWC